MLSLSPPARYDFRSCDLAAVRRAISAYLKPFALQAASDGPYDARICHRKLVGTELTVIEYGDAVSVDAGRMGSFYVIQIPLRGSYQFVADGQRAVVQQGDAHVVHPQMHLRMEFSSCCQLLVLRTADPRLQEIEVSAPGAQRRSSLGRLLSCSGGAGASLGRAVDFLATELIQGRLFATGTPAAAAAESLLMEAMIQAIATPQVCSTHERPAYLVRAERYITDRLDSELSLADIVKVSRSSARSLFRAFQAVHGASPLLWVRTQRLARVHAELLDPRNSRCKVSDIALKWGFSHFGHFCAAYRRVYGTTPSQTRSHRGLNI